MAPLSNGQNFLRVLTCGSVDDGKSTLIGRLLYDTKSVLADQNEALERDSRRYGTHGNEIDLALLVDGLQAEREQGITIDVAYRFFSTRQCSFIVADTPGHEQYTRNMVTGASTADAAIILVDARKGILPQTCRHSVIAHLLGIRHIVLAINKMDLVAYDRDVFTKIEQSFAQFAAKLGFASWHAIPLSGYTGDNVVTRSHQMDWYKGPPLLEHLETIEMDISMAQTGPLRLPVQRIARDTAGNRYIQGTVCSGQIAIGDEVCIMPSGFCTQVAQITNGSRSVASAVAGEAISIVIANDVDCGRGAVLVAPTDRPRMADQFEATLVWMNQNPLVPGRRYLLKIGTQTIPASVSSPKYKYHVETLDHLSAATLSMNDIGVAILSTATPIVFDPYHQNKTMGGFILVDPNSFETLATGTISHEMRRSQNVHWQATKVDQAARAALMQQKPLVIWFTGLSGSGKSTIAALVEQILHQQGRHTYLLDGDNLRHGLNHDLGFTAPDRIENIRRVGEVSKLMSDAGLIVLAAFISPFAAERQLVRDMLPDGTFAEVFVDAPLEAVEARDPKGLYKKARAGLLPNFTGIDMPYERPTNPDLILDSARDTIEHCADKVVAFIARLTSQAG